MLFWCLKLREEMEKMRREKIEKKRIKKEKKRAKEEKKEKRKEKKERKHKEGTTKATNGSDDDKKFKLINDIKETKADEKLQTGEGEVCENELLERSGITEELEQPVTSREPCCLSDSTQSSKRKRGSPQSTNENGEEALNLIIVLFIGLFCEVVFKSNLDFCVKQEDLLLKFDFL